MRETRYSLNANLPEGATKADIPAMLQQLLADRFHLSAHREFRETSVYALVVAQGGPKPQPCDIEKCPHNQSYVTPSSVSVTTSAIEELVTDLTRASDQPIVDETNLTGHFTIAVEGTLPGAVPTEDIALPTIFGALRRLGLRLEARKESLEFLVVDGGSPASIEN
jgi:uncharacterized protein (TIGR03435 family)